MECVAEAGRDRAGPGRIVDEAAAGIPPHTLVVSVRETRARGRVWRAVDYEAPEARHVRGSIEYTFLGQVLPPPLVSHDFALLAVLFLGMSKGLDIHVRGRISRVLLANLEEFQDAWCAWRPRSYTKIRITADEESAAGPAGDGRAILAYSGGVDASFTLLRHTGADAGAGRRRQKIGAAAIINGLDIPPDHQAVFQEAVASARATLKDFDLPLTVIESNWKQVACTDWAMEYFVGLASCLYPFAGLMSVGLVGNCVDYRSMVWPWGSNAITNPLLDSGGFRMMTDGAGHTRPEKAAVIARFPALKNRLRVCWWGPLHGGGGGNCGRCEKCLRTRMAFLCHGVDPGVALPARHTLVDVALIGLRTKVPLAELLEILATARRHDIRASWVPALRVGLVVSVLAIGIRRVYCPLKVALMRAARAFRPTVTRLAPLLGGAAALVYLALLLRPLPLLLRRPFLEEASYALSAARLLGTGAAPPVAALQGTGAAAPVMALLYAPAFGLAHGGTATALRLCLFAEILLFALASLAIGASLRRADREESPATAGWIAALVFSNYTLSAAFLDGLETALAAALVFITFAWYARRRARDTPPTWRRALTLGGLCGLCLVARQDAALFAVALALTHAGLPRRGAPGGLGAWRSRILKSVALLAVAGAVWALWAFGTGALPGSASPAPLRFQEVRPMSPRIATLRVLSNQCLGIVHLATRHDHLGTSNIAGLVLLLTVAGGMLAVPSLRSRAGVAFKAWRRRWDLGALAPLWLYSACLLVAHTLFYQLPHLQSHYLVVPRLLLLFLLVSFGVAFLGTFARGRSFLITGLAVWGLVSLGLHVRDFSGAGGNVMLGPTGWISGHLQPGDRVGMFQSGTTALLDPDRIVNLDGNMDREALAAVRAGRLSELLEARHVRYLIDRREYLALAWRDTSLARRAVRVATLDNELEVWGLR